MENKSIFLPAFGYGLLVSAALIIFKLVLYLAGIDDQSYWQIFYYVIFALGLLYSMTTVRKNIFDGYITFGKAFMVGFYATLSISIVMGIYTYIYMSYINPGMLEDVLAQAESKILESNPDISDEDLNTALDAAKMFMKPGIMIFSTFFMSVIMGTLLSLVGAAFAKKKNTEVDV